MTKKQSADVATDDVWRFYFAMYMEYGLAFGAIYGGAAGLMMSIFGWLITAFLITAPFGLLLGLPLGLIEGLILGPIAVILVHRGASVQSVARSIRRATPLLTVAIGIVIIVIDLSITGRRSSALAWNWIALFVSIVALASWHAAIKIARKFTDKFDSEGSHANR